MSAVASAAPRATQGLVGIDGVEVPRPFMPSRFNARTTTDDGTLVLYNSFTGAFTGFPQKVASQVEDRLHQDGFTGPAQGLTKYLHERGYLVPRGTDELDRMRMLYGSQQHKPDQLELILLSSEECNFRCVYCYESFPRGTMEPWVRTSLIKLLEKRAKRLNRFSVSYFGGEPLLGLEAIEDMAPAFQKICQEHDIPLSGSITTNAYLLTPDVFVRLVDWNIRTYQITIDGAPEDHDQHRILKGGGGTFDTIFSNVVAMKNIPGEFRVYLRVNFDQANLPRMEQFLGLLEPLKQDPRFVLRFYPVGTWGGPNDDSLEICGLHGERERQQLDVLASELGHNTESRMPYLQPSGMGVCYAARPYNLLVGADGKIMKCTVALDTKDYNIVGKMTPDGRAEIDLDRFAKWVKPYFEEDAVCKKCFYVPVCQGSSCPIPRIEENERPCPPEKKEIGRTLASIWTIKQHAAKRRAVPGGAAQAQVAVQS